MSLSHLRLVKQSPEPLLFPAAASPLSLPLLGEIPFEAPLLILRQIQMQFATWARMDVMPVIFTDSEKFQP